MSQYYEIDIVRLAETSVTYEKRVLAWGNPVIRSYTKRFDSMAKRDNWLNSKIKAIPTVQTEALSSAEIFEE